MNRASSVARVCLGFLVGNVALASTFGATMAIAVTRSTAPHGVPSSGDYRFFAAALVLLVAGFACAVAAAGRAGAPLPAARVGFIAGLGGVALLLSVMMLAGASLGMGGSLVVAALTGIGTALIAVSMVVPRRARGAEAT